MSRLPSITTRDQLSKDQHHNFDTIASSRGYVSGPFSVLLNSPELAGRVGHLGTYLRFEGILQGAERELAIISTSREFDCDFEWSAHEPLARLEGVSDEAIQVVSSNGPLDRLNSSEALIIQYCREIVQNHRVSDKTFMVAKDRFGIQGITELTTTIGYYAMLACALNAFEVEAPADAPRLT